MAGGRLQALTRSPTSRDLASHAELPLPAASPLHTSSDCARQETLWVASRTRGNGRVPIGNGPSSTGMSMTNRGGQCVLGDRWPIRLSMVGEENLLRDRWKEELVRKKEIGWEPFGAGWRTTIDPQPVARPPRIVGVGGCVAGDVVDRLANALIQPV